MDTSEPTNLDALLSTFKEERRKLEIEIIDANVRMARLKRVIDAMEEHLGPAEPAQPAGPSVVEMALAAVDQMHNGTTFDAQSLRDKMTTLYPDDSVRIKKGVYNAMATLQRRNKIQRVPGGFQAIRPITPPV